jgi:regulator of sigma E protease
MPSSDPSRPSAPDPAVDPGPAAASEPAAAPRPWLTLALVAAAVSAAVWLPGSRAFAVTLVVLLGLIGFHELGHLLAARATGVGASEFSVGFGPQLAATRPRPGRTRFVLRAIPLGGFVRIKGMGESGAGRPDDDTPGASYLEVSKPRQVAVAVAGPAANLLLAFVVFVALFAAVGVPSPTTAVRPLDGSPAATAGLVEGDTLVAVAGAPIGAWGDVSPALAAAPDGPVELVVRDAAGVERTVAVAPAEVDGRRQLGVAPVLASSRVGPLQAVADGAELTWATVTGTAGALVAIPQMVVDLPSQLVGTAEDPNARFVSPVGMADLAAQSAERDGVAGVLLLVGLVSVFLALFNLLPVPPLDGGHIVVSLYEGVASRLRGRPVAANRAVLSRVAVGVGVLLLVVGVSSLLLDVLRPLTLP